MAENSGHGGLERCAEEHFVEAEEALGVGGEAVVVGLGEHEAAGEGVAVEEGDGGHGISGFVSIEEVKERAEGSEEKREGNERSEGKKRKK